MSKNILFVIKTFQGKGGHYYSLLNLAEKLGVDNNVYILNIGRFVSPVIENSHLSYEFRYFDNKNFIYINNIVGGIVKEKNIELIHAYDFVAYLASYFAAYFHRIKIVLTKCGGAPLCTSYFPRPENMIVFTKEDYLFYREKKFPHISLIPNRVSAFDSDALRIDNLRKKYSINGKKVVLRIGRISDYYFKTLVQSVDLVKGLHEIDDSFVLLIIGSKDSDVAYRKLIGYIGSVNYIYVETTNEFNSNAKELIDVASVVIGTGRSFMEACSKDKIMFAPCSNTKYPVLVTRENFELVFLYNFSERFVLNKSEDLIEQIYSRIMNYGISSKQWFVKYFSSHGIESKMEEYYDESCFCSIRTLLTVIRAINALTYISFKSDVKMFISKIG